MLLNELFALSLIPSLINLRENGTTTQNSSSFDDKTFEDFFRMMESSSESDQPQRKVHKQNDPLLAEILEEERKLNLAFSDDYFDHLEDKSEEVRELIRSRQDAIKSTVQSSKPYDHEQELGQFRTDIDNPSTEFPILTPSSEAPVTSSSTSKPKPGGGLIGSTFSNVHQGAHSLIDTISKPFAQGARSLFGRKKSTTTTTTTAAPHVPEPLAQPTAPLNCTQYQTEINGECHNVLQQLPCNDGEWLVEDEMTNKGKCVENKCAHRQDEAWFGGNCIHVSTDKPCHAGMKTIIYKSGKVECDCKSGHLYNEQDANCYEAYRQGPCPAGQYFIIPKVATGKSGKPMCVPNPCLTDGLYCNAPRCPRQRGCVQLGSNCGTDPTAKYAIHPVTNTPFCTDSEARQPSLIQPDKIIGNVPTLSCAPGTRRDILGNCRTPTDITFS